MSGRVTLATDGKGAFRVEVAGVRPDDVTRLILVGQGDEREMELPAGEYTANITNIGTGDRQRIEFRVGDAEHLLKIGRDRTRSANWRSVSEKRTVPKGWRAAGQGVSKIGEGSMRPLPSLRALTASGWRAFSGSVMFNDDLPNTLKVVRSKTWSTAPLLRVEFAGSDGSLARSFVPLFSGGTLIRWNDDDVRAIEIEACAPKSAAIVGSLTNSVREELPQILQWAAGSDEADAVQSVMHSRDDPWIAAATGLLLIGASRLKVNGSSLVRLAARNPLVADLGVVAAWGKAADAPEEAGACLELLREARENGTVYFWQSCSIADRLLIGLVCSSKSTAFRARVRREHARWRRLQGDAFKVGAFLGWSAPTRNSG